jgi:uncharacterized low-complexity protein
MSQLSKKMIKRTQTSSNRKFLSSGLMGTGLMGSGLLSAGLLLPFQETHAQNNPSSDIAIVTAKQLRSNLLSELGCSTHNTDKSEEGKCGEGKCGEGKCGEGKCGEGKCGEEEP